MTNKDLMVLTQQLGPIVREVVTKAVQAAVEPVWLENRRLEMRVLDLETRPAIVWPAGPQGERGLDGADGKDGIGMTGADGLPGRDGKDGADGLNGKDGTDGLNGKDGAAGLNGKDGTDAAVSEAFEKDVALFERRLSKVETKTVLTDRVESDVKRLTQRIGAVEIAQRTDDELAPDDATALFVETLTAAMKAASPIQ